MVTKNSQCLKVILAIKNQDKIIFQQVFSFQAFVIFLWKKNVCLFFPTMIDPEDFYPRFFRNPIRSQVIDSK